MRLIDKDELTRRLNTGMDIIEMMQTVIDMPTIEPKQADDLISRDDAIDALWKIKEERDSVYYTTAIYSAVDILEQLPSAQERKTGRWIEVSDDSAPINYACSVCYAGIKHQGFANYCPNCGAKMEVENE